MRRKSHLDAALDPREEIDLEDGSCWLIGHGFEFHLAKGTIKTYDWSGTIEMDWHPGPKWKATSVTSTNCPIAVGWGFSPRTALHSLADSLVKRGYGRSTRAKELASRDWPSWMTA